MKNVIFGSLLLSLIFTACLKDDPLPQPDPLQPSDPIDPVDTVNQSSANLKIELHAWFDGGVLVAGNTYHNVSNYRVNVTDLKLYLSHIYGVQENGDTVELADIAFFDLTNGSDALMLEDVPVGNYAAFGFGIGVAPEMNSPGNPDFSIALFDDDHPLSVTNNMYWGWATGYRFVIFDGKYNVDPDGTDPLLSGYSFHTGKDESYRQVDFSDADFAVSGNGGSIVNLDMHVDRFFYNSADTIDIAVDNQTHGSNTPLSNRLSDLIQEAIEFGE